MNRKPAVDRSFPDLIAMIQGNLLCYFVFILSMKPLTADTA